MVVRTTRMALHQEIERVSFARYWEIARKLKHGPLVVRGVYKVKA